MRNFSNVFAKVYEHLQQIHLQRTSLYRLSIFRPLATLPVAAGHLQLHQLQQNQIFSTITTCIKRYIKKIYQKIILFINASSGKRQIVEFPYSSATIGNNN